MAEDALHPRIAEHDPPARRLGQQDADRHGLQDGVELGLVLAQALLGLVAPGDVEHRPDHPHRPARAVADDVAAIDHRGVAAVAPAEAVLVAPGVAGPVDRRMDAAGNPIAIVGMDLREPPRALRHDVGEVVAVGQRQRLVPADMVGDEVPVPDRVGGGARRQAIALLGRLQGKVGGFVLGDVADRADEADGHPVLDDRPTACGEPALRAGIGRDHPVVDVAHAGAGRVQGRLDRRVRARPVVGVDAAEIGLRVGDRTAGGHAEQGAHPCVPPQFAGGEVEIEDADAGGLDREAQLFFGARAGGERLLAVLDRPTQLELNHHLARQRGERRLLTLVEPLRTRHRIDHAKGAEGEAVLRVQRRAGIEADLRIAGDEGVVAGAGILGQVGNDEDAVAAERVRADRLRQRRLTGTEADPRLEPLPVLGDEADERRRGLAGLRGQEDDVLEAGLGGRVENVVGVEGGQARSVLRVVDRCGGHGAQAAFPWEAALPRGAVPAAAGSTATRVPSPR